MMKTLTLAAMLVWASVSAVAQAASVDNVIVHATQVSFGTLSIGSRSAYNQHFDVSLTNVAEKTVDLSGFCLAAFGRDGQVFELDVVDEVLTTGTLKQGASVKGMAVFSSEDEAVYKALMIKLSADCDRG